MNQKTVGLTLSATILALALILVAGSGLPLLDGVAYAQSAGPTLTATAPPDGSMVDLRWTAVADADSYELYKQQEGGAWSAAMSMTGTSYTDTAVTGGNSYFYIVRAVEDGTAGAWSNTPKVDVPGGTAAPTTKPTLTAAADGLTAIDLSWTAVSGASHYDLRRWNGDTNAWDRIGSNPDGDFLRRYQPDVGRAILVRYSRRQRWRQWPLVLSRRRRLHDPDVAGYYGRT